MKTLKTIIAITVLSLLTFSCSNDDSGDSKTTDLNYSNGNLSTGTTSADKTVAPSGYTWSEVQAPNKLTGALAVMGSYSLADDFTVPEGEKWNITKINFYIFKTDYLEADSPVKDVRYEIYNTNPSTAGAVKVYGDFSVNKYFTSADAKMYRISAQYPDKTARKIFKITASSTDLELTAGTYWLKWQTNVINGQTLGHYHPSNTIIGSVDLPAYNALQQYVNTWVVLKDGSAKVDFPFEIVGTKTKI